MLYLHGFCYFLSVLPFSDGLNVLKEVGVSNLPLLVLDHFTPDPSRVFQLTTKLGSTTISVSLKVDTSIKRSTVTQKVFPFLFVLLKLEFNTQERYFSSGALSISKET